MTESQTWNWPCKDPVLGKTLAKRAGENTLCEKAHELTSDLFQFYDSARRQKSRKGMTLARNIARGFFWFLVFFLSLKPRNVFIKRSNPTKKGQRLSCLSGYSIWRDRFAWRSSTALGLRMGQFKPRPLPVWPAANDFTSPLELKNGNWKYP